MTPRFNQQMCVYISLQILIHTWKNSNKLKFCFLFTLLISSDIILTTLTNLNSQIWLVRRCCSIFVQIKEWVCGLSTFSHEKVWTVRKLRLALFCFLFLQGGPSRGHHRCPWAGSAHVRTGYRQDYNVCSVAVRCPYTQLGCWWP
jgi:hypothetical protein